MIVVNDEGQAEKVCSPMLDCLDNGLELTLSDHVPLLVNIESSRKVRYRVSDVVHLLFEHGTNAYGAGIGCDKRWKIRVEHT